MPAPDNAKIQRIQGGDIINVVTGGQFTFNSTQLTMDSLSTGLSSTNFSTIIAANLNTLGGSINSLAGSINDMRTILKNLGIIAAT